MVKQVNFGDSPISLATSNKTVTESNSNSFSLDKNMNGFDLSINAVFILVQVFCSCFAGIYNEHLLKNEASDINIYIQNVYMYLDSILCNALILLIQGNLFSAFTATSLSEVFKFKVLIIMFNNCAIGIITSFFLKYLNSILKTFASALELLFTAILCYLLFAIPVYINTMVAIVVVSTAVYLYSQSPVVNSKNFVVKESKHQLDDRQALLDISSSSDDLQMDKVIIK